MELSTLECLNTYNAENGVSILSLNLILWVLVIKTCIKGKTNKNFSQI